VRFTLRDGSELPKVVLTHSDTEDLMTKLKFAAGSILLALVAACSPGDGISGVHAQQAPTSTVSYPEPVEGAGDGQVFEYH
jgi:hypothetical protein